MALATGAFYYYWKSFFELWWIHSFSVVICPSAYNPFWDLDHYPEMRDRVIRNEETGPTTKGNKKMWMFKVTSCHHFRIGSIQLPSDSRSSSNDGSTSIRWGKPIFFYLKGETESNTALSHLFHKWLDHGSGLELVMILKPLWCRRWKLLDVATSEC